MSDDWEDDWENPDYPDDDDDEVDVIACGNCGAEVYAEAPQCPRCGEYLTRPSTHPFAGRSLWFIGLGILGIVATIVTLVLLGF